MDYGVRTFYIKKIFFQFNKTLFHLYVFNFYFVFLIKLGNSCIIFHDQWCWVTVQKTSEGSGVKEMEVKSKSHYQTKVPNQSEKEKFMSSVGWIQGHRLNDCVNAWFSIAGNPNSPFCIPWRKKKSNSIYVF